MCLVRSDSCENGITKEKVHTKGSGKLRFSEYVRYLTLTEVHFLPVYWKLRGKQID